MSNLSKLLFDEIMLYQNNINYDFVSDLDIIHSEHNDIFIPRNRLIHNVNLNLKIDKQINNTVCHTCTVHSINDIHIMCIICIENINMGDVVYNLKCGTKEQPHIYHKLCFEKWNKPSCPYCRREIK